jgi:hypothetical protein
MGNNLKLPMTYVVVYMELTYIFIGTKSPQKKRGGKTQGSMLALDDLGTAMLLGTSTTARNLGNQSPGR